MRPILVFQTDFTYKESVVYAIYGVVKTVDRELEGVRKILGTRGVHQRTRSIIYLDSDY